jgi:hypothetical protein
MIVGEVTFSRRAKVDSVGGFGSMICSSASFKLSSSSSSSSGAGGKALVKKSRRAKTGSREKIILGESIATFAIEDLSSPPD